MHGRGPLYTACCDFFLPFYPLNTFVWIWVSFPTTYWFVSYLATTTYSLWLCHSPLPDKKNYFICLFIVAFLSTTVWVFSLAIPHGMHLVFPIHHSLFWVVCHPSKTFPLKEFEQELQNRLSLSPHHQTMPSLTSDPWLTTPVLAGYRLIVLGPCACSTSVYVQSLSAAHTFSMDWRFIYAFCCSFLISYGVNYFLILHSLWLASSKGWALLDYGLFSLLVQCLLLLLAW